GGAFLPNGRHDFERRPVALLAGDFVDRTRRVLQHELTHRFVAYYYPQAPTWLNEGLAYYFEMLTIEDGMATLGHPPVSERFWPGPWKSDSTGHGTLVPVSEAPTASALLAMTPADFYGNENSDITTSEGKAAARLMYTHY